MRVESFFFNLLIKVEYFAYLNMFVNDILKVMRIFKCNNILTYDKYILE